MPPIEYRNNYNPQSPVVITDGEHKNLNYIEPSINTTNVQMDGNDKGGTYNIDYISFRNVIGGEDKKGKLVNGQILVIPGSRLILRGGTKEQLEQPLDLNKVKVAVLEMESL